MEKMNENMQEQNQEIAIEVKDLCIGYKNIQAYSIKKSLLKSIPILVPLPPATMMAVIVFSFS